MNRQTSTNDAIEDVESAKPGAKSVDHRTVDIGTHNNSKEEKQKQRNAQSSDVVKKSIKQALQDRKRLKAHSLVKLPANKQRNFRQNKQWKKRLGLKRSQHDTS